MPKPNSGESRENFVARCLSSAEAKRTRPDDHARLGFCEGVYDEHVKKEHASGHQSHMSESGGKSLAGDELQAAMLESVRTRKSPGLYGVRTARPYLKSLDICIAGAGMCPKSLFGKSTDEWHLLIKEADSRLTYSAPDLVIKELEIRTSGLLTPKALMEFPHVITTTREDRDHDVLESGGAVVEAKALLAFHNQSQPIGPFLGVTHQSKDAVHGHSAILDTSYGRDMAVLAEGGALSISHGFKALEAEPRGTRRAADGKDYPTGWHVKRFHIYEVSLVSVPANADAVITTYSKGLLNHPLVKSWAAQKYEGRPVMIPVGIDLQVKVNGQELSTAAGSGQRGGQPLAKQVADLREKRTLQNPPPNAVSGTTPIGSGSNATPSPGADSLKCPNCGSPAALTGPTFVSEGVDQSVAQCNACGYVFTPSGAGQPGAAENERNANGRGNSNPSEGSGPKQPLLDSGSAEGARGNDPNAISMAFPTPGAKPTNNGRGPRQPMLNGRDAGDLQTKAGAKVSMAMADRLKAAHGHLKAAGEHVHKTLGDAGYAPNSDGDFDDYGNPADPNNPSKGMGGGDYGNSSGAGGQASIADDSLAIKAGAKMSHARADLVKIAHLRASAAADHLHSVLVDAGHEPGLGDDGEKSPGDGRSAAAAKVAYGQGTGDANMHGAAKAAAGLLVVKAGASPDGISSGNAVLELDGSKMMGMDCYMPGSFEWIADRLRRTAGPYLQAHGIDSGDYVDDIATFADSAIVCIRDYSSAKRPCYRMSWSISADVPQWTGTPREVSVQPQIVEKMLSGRIAAKSQSLAALSPKSLVGQIVARAYDPATTDRQIDESIKALEVAGEMAVTLKQQRDEAALVAEVHELLGVGAS